MSMLSDLRQKIAGGEIGLEDPMLYISARMRDAEHESKDQMRLAYATERAAIKIIGRFDSDGSLVREFMDERDLIARNI